MNISDVTPMSEAIRVRGFLSVPKKKLTIISSDEVSQRVFSNFVRFFIVRVLIFICAGGKTAITLRITACASRKNRRMDKKRHPYAHLQRPNDEHMNASIRCPVATLYYALL